MIDVDAGFGEEFLDFAVRQALAEIPTNGANNDLGFKLPALEQPWLSLHSCVSGFQLSIRSLQHCESGLCFFYFCHLFSPFFEQKALRRVQCLLARPRQ